MMRKTIAPGLGVLLLLWSNPARPEAAKVPSPFNCSVPCAINLVGCADGAADAAGLFTVTVRDLANNPKPYAVVVLDFTDVCNEVRVADTQFAAGLVVDAPSHTVRTFTDNNGVATLCVMGAAPGSVAGGTSAGVKIFADGVLLTEGISHPPVSIGTYDLDGATGGGAAGVGPSDLSVWMGDAFTGYRARSDYDCADAGCAGNLGPADLSRWLKVFFAAHSATNGAMLGCP